jgi:hypothetical protein
MTEPIATFEFFDDRGPVPAARHRNPDGTEGGWVSADSVVHPSATIEYGAEVFDRSSIGANTLVLRFAKVFDKGNVGQRCTVGGFVSHMATVGDDSIVEYGVNLYPRAWLVRDAEVRRTTEVAGGFGGDLNWAWTFYRGRGGQALLGLGRHAGTLEYWCKFLEGQERLPEQDPKFSRDGLARVVRFLQKQGFWQTW